MIGVREIRLADAEIMMSRPSAASAASRAPALANILLADPIECRDGAKHVRSPDVSKDAAGRLLTMVLSAPAIAAQFTDHRWKSKSAAQRQTGNEKGSGNRPEPFLTERSRRARLYSPLNQAPSRRISDRTNPSGSAPRTWLSWTTALFE